MSALSPRLGVIGSGAIVPFHLDAALGVGMQLVAIGSREGSVSAGAIAARYGISTVAKDWRELLDMDLDAVLISVTPEATSEILQVAMDRGLPTLVEKPVAMDAVTLKRLADHTNSENVIVGYNRRHYGSTRAAQAFIANQSGPVYFSARIPELSTASELCQDRVTYSLLANSVHVLDLLNFLFGAQEVSTASTFGDSGVTTWCSALMRSKATAEAEAPVGGGSVVVSFGTPGTYRLEIMASGAAAELSPVEFFSAFDGMEVQHPSADVPIKRYRMRQSGRFELDEFDGRFKPGFYRQYQEFRDLVVGDDGHLPLNSASLTDALRATELAEALLGA